MLYIYIYKVVPTEMLAIGISEISNRTLRAPSTVLRSCPSWLCEKFHLNENRCRKHPEHPKWWKNWFFFQKKQWNKVNRCQKMWYLPSLAADVSVWFLLQNFPHNQKFQGTDESIESDHPNLMASRTCINNTPPCWLQIHRDLFGGFEVMIHVSWFLCWNWGDIRGLKLTISTLLLSLWDEKKPIWGTSEIQKSLWVEKPFHQSLVAIVTHHFGRKTRHLCPESMLPFSSKTLADPSNPSNPSNPSGPTAVTQMVDLQRKGAILG